MILFRKYKTNKIERGRVRPVTIFKYWESAKQKLAFYLQAKSELLSVKSKKAALLLFLLMFGAISVSIAVKAIINNNDPIATRQPPAFFFQDRVAIRLRPDSVITQNDFKKVSQIKTYLLQLQNDSAGKVKFDSIMQQLPHLLDSINQFEKMYLSQ